MPLCMHWVLERRALDDGWDAVLSSASLARHLDYSNASAALSLGVSDDSFFAVMSGRQSSARFHVDPDIEPFAHPGLPADASKYACDLLKEPLATQGFLRKALMEDCGHLIITDLAAAATGACSDLQANTRLSANAPAQDYLARLYLQLQIILGRTAQNATPNLADQEILTGRVVERKAGEFANQDMDAMSHHTRLRHSKRLSELAPCTDDNLRLLIAYGM